MSPNNSFERKPLLQKAVTPGGRDGWSRPDHTNPATVDDFDRERMGVAAKE